MHVISTFDGDDIPVSSDQPTPHFADRLPTHVRRESILLWCIGATFGVAMLILLIGMIFAEMSVHRVSADWELQSTPVPPTYSIVAAH